MMKSVNQWLGTYLLVCILIWYCDASAKKTLLIKNPGIKIVYKWKQLDFSYGTESDRQNALNSGEFNATNMTPFDSDVYYTANTQLVFITIPRLQNGVPATLGTVTGKTRDGNPVIAPYPSWAWHQNLSSCNQNRLVSVFRIKIDECGRLWLLDTGGVLNNQRICSPQILAFDLTTNEVINRYEVPDSQLNSNSLLVTPIVDVRDPPPLGQCKNTFIYVADSRAMALIVYDVQNTTSWRITDKTFYPYPNFGTFEILGQRFDLMDGIVGMDLSPYGSGEDRILYYHALVSGTENWVYTSNIRNQSIFAANSPPDPDIFHTYLGQRKTQCAAMAIDKDGISYFGLPSKTSLNCWNTALQYGKFHTGLVSYNPRTLPFISGIKVINNNDSQELWFVTTPFQRIVTGTLDPNETNFRIQTAQITDLTGLTKCLI